MVVMFVDQAWEKTDAPTILESRRRGATAALERILGPTPDGAERATELLRRMADACTNAGRPPYSGLSSLQWPGAPLGDLWRAADLVREHRGDGHVCAWVSHQLTAIEVLLMTEAWWGLQLNTYMRTRGWPAEEVDATLTSLIDRGILEDAATDEEMQELLALLEPWSREIVATGGSPADPSTLNRA